MLENLFRILKHDPHFNEVIKKLKGCKEYQKKVYVIMTVFNDWG